MPDSMSVFICSSLEASAQAQAFLEARGYPAANIKVQKVTNFSYDARQFNDPPGQADLASGFVVIGQK